MKTLIKIFSVIFVLISVLEAQYHCKISVEAEKKTYVKGELIQVGINVINIGSATIDEKLNSMRIQLFDEHNEELKLWGPPIQYFLPSTYGLKPNEEKFAVIELNQFFGKIYSIAGATQHYFEPGNYTLIISFHPSYIIADSIQISFQVVEPFGDDQIVYNKYVDLIKRGPAGKYSMSQLIEGIRLLHETYPTSVYNPIFLEHLDTYYSIITLEHDKAAKARKDLVEKYPSSLRSWNIVNNMLQKTSSKEKKVELLRKIQLNNKSPLIQKIIEKKLNAEMK